MNRRFLIAHISWLLGMILAISPSSLAQTKRGAEIVVEDGQDSSWDYWAARPPGFEQWYREANYAFRRKDYQKVIALSDKFAPNHETGVGLVYLYRGIAKQKLKQYDAAKSDVKTALHKARTGYARRDFYATCYEYLAIISVQQGRMKEAQDYLRGAIRESPDDPKYYDAAAWFLATSQKADARNGAEAVRLATKACELTRWNSSDCLESLAAANAEIGDFASAIKWQGKAVALAKGNKMNMEKRLSLYQRNQPYRAALPMPSG